MFAKPSIEESAPKFRNRAEAGSLLASKLLEYRDRPDAIVLALPRGGVPVAFEIARSLHLPLDIFLVQKLGVPGQEELAMGALSTGNTLVLQEDVIRALGIPQSAVDSAIQTAEQELRRREQLYRDSRPAPALENKTIILVDDGLATGSSMKAAIAALRQQHPRCIVVAVPVAAPQTCAEFQNDVDQVICLQTPADFLAVGLHYQDFSQLSDDAVRELLRRAEPLRTRS